MKLVSLCHARPSNESLAAFYASDTYICHETSGPTSAGSRATHALARIVKHVPPAAPRTLLDYGAGGGAFLAAAQSAGWQARGFEPGRRGLEHCSNAGLDVTDKLSELAEGTFGLVTFHHVFEHLTNPAETLGIVRQLLANNGRLYIEVPNVGSLRARLAMTFLSRGFQVDERHRAFPVHLIYYSKATLQKMLKKMGWTVEIAFTVGIGLDEFFVRPVVMSPTDTTGSQRSAGSPLPEKKRLRHRLRDTFLRAGLGENLAVIAYPNPP